jgi:HD-GYP domain-containing protein (c-di-GMP phosphodiesterase class II)
MISLSKLLKPGFLRSYLRDVLPLLGEGGFALVTQQAPPGEKVLAGCGDLPDAPAEDKGFDFEQATASYARSLRLPLMLEGKPVGHLAVGCLTAPSPLFEASARFLARSLEEIMGRELVKRSLGEEALEQYREVALMQRSVVNLNSSMQIQDVMRALVDECAASSFPATYAMIFNKDSSLEHSRRLTPQDPGGPAHTETALSRLSKSQIYKAVVAGGKGELVNDLDADPRWRREIPGLSSLLVAPVRGSRMALGAIVLAGMDPARPFRAMHLKKVITLASIAGVSIANAYHFEQVQQILMALIKAMATAIDARDRLTAGHSHRVAQLGFGLSKVASEDQEVCPEVSFDQTEQLEIFYAGLLHDIGKIGVREEVLTKATRLPLPHMELIGLRLALWGELNEKPWQDMFARLESINRAYDLSLEDENVVHQLERETVSVSGKAMSILTANESLRLLTPRGNLTPEEWQEIRRHPEESHRILQNIPLSAYFPNMLAMILQHHERLDGSGYPYGIKGANIIDQSRIMAIVDVYDALRQDRHYKKALSHELAMNILLHEAARNRLDSRFVKLFAQHIDRIESAMTSGIPFFPGRDAWEDENA